MADAGDSDTEELERCFKEFVCVSAAGKKLSEDDKKQMNSKACGKMVKDVLPKEVSTIADASVFPKYKEKGKQNMPMSNFKNFIEDCAHEYAKKKTKNTKLPKDDPEVQKWNDDFKDRIKKGSPHVKKTAASTTGNVSGLTDHSQYTGAHKQRFDESGKGKGVDGRENRHENTGYVGDYKGKDTFDKSTKK